MKIKRILLIALIIPFFSFAQDKGSGNRSYKSSGKDNSKDYIKGNISGKIVDSKTCFIQFHYQF